MHQTSAHRTDHPGAGAAESRRGSGHGAQHGPGSDHTRPAPSLVAIAGHPLHAMLIPFPIATLLGAFVADLAAWWTGDPFATRAALWLNGAGVLSGGLAAAFGLADFLSIERARAHTVGWVHALGAGATLVLATASWLARLGDSAGTASPWAVGLLAAGAGVLGVTAWAGGELPYRHLIGVAGHGSHGGHGVPEQGAAQGEGHTGHVPPATGGPAGQHAARHEGQNTRQGRQEAGERASSSREEGQHGRPDHGGGGHEGMMHADANPAFAVTRPQLAAVSLLTLLALIGAVIWAASIANLTLSSKDVGGLVMPPGMVMTRQTTAETMHDMAAIDPRQVRSSAPTDARGDQPLQPRFEDDAKVFDLETSAIDWRILPNVPTSAYAFNGQVPGPRIRVAAGDRVRFNVTNRLPETTTVHWHGLILPNAMDGPAEVTQEPIPPGETYTYDQGDCITPSGAQTVEDCAEIGVVESGAEPFGGEAGAS
jgi:uncharacterized membrane protein